MKNIMETLRKVLGTLLAVTLGASLSCSALADTITYFHNDLVGSPVAATNPARQVIWRESYRPYGERLLLEPASLANEVWFTSRKEDPRTELVYMGARYYDPRIGRFMGVDPVGFGEKNVHSFNRYAYANNNPYKYVDPDGRSGQALVAIGLGTGIGVGIALTSPDQREQMGRVLGQVNDLARDIFLWGLLSPLLSEGAKSADKGSTNPYNGPVDSPVIVVDPQGNAIPVGAGEKITSSPNGDYQQVRDKDGNETGVRIDRGGHRNQADPLARDPHAHVPGVTTPSGNPHLPIRRP